MVLQWCYDGVTMCDNDESDKEGHRVTGLTEVVRDMCIMMLQRCYNGVTIV
jgi:hypothetical protein